MSENVDWSEADIWRPWTGAPTADDIPDGTTTWAGHALKLGYDESCPYPGGCGCGGMHPTWVWVCSCGGATNKRWETRGGAVDAWRWHLVRKGTIEHVIRERRAGDEGNDLADLIARVRLGDDRD